jgi:hypothetical protein
MCIVLRLLFAKSKKIKNFFACKAAEDVVRRKQDQANDHGLDVALHVGRMMPTHNLEIFQHRDLIPTCRTAVMRSLHELSI